MHKLLVPFDTSDSATRALQYAIRLSKENGPVSIHIVYAHEPPIVYGEVSLYMSEEKASKMQREHAERVLQPGIQLAETAGVSFTSEILIGDVARSISKRAEELGCDGIVMGTRGLGAIGNLMLGSVATKVIHLTKLPVTLVK